MLYNMPMRAATLNLHSPAVMPLAVPMNMLSAPCAPACHCLPAGLRKHPCQLSLTSLLHSWHAHPHDMSAFHHCVHILCSCHCLPLPATACHCLPLPAQGLQEHSSL
jgi:hypothetical protein